MRVIVDMPDNLVRAVDQAASDADRSRAWMIREACRTVYGTARRKQPADHVFAAQSKNALRCETCGLKKSEH